MSRVNFCVSKTSQILCYVLQIVCPIFLFELENLCNSRPSLPNLSFVSCSVLEREHLELLLVLNECMKLDWLT